MTVRALRTQVAGYGVSIAALHALGFALLLPAARIHPALLGMGFLAYTLGLRHAFDVDHIAAIDNTVRKLLEQKRNPMGVGFYFSLGHSTVVFALAILATFVARWAAAVPHLKTIGGLLGGTVSGSFLLIIGILNLLIWIDIFWMFRSLRRGDYQPGEMEHMLAKRGLIARFAAPLFQMVNSSRQAYPVGLLFGLGFDTASEIALLALAAGVGASGGLPLPAIIALPVLFAAGMCLMDTADGVFMTTAYRWAFCTPLRKIYYNLTITGLSVIAALFIGSVEIAQVFGRALNAGGGTWTWLRQLDFGQLGYAFVALFIVTWLFSYWTWRVLRLEERTGVA